MTKLTTKEVNEIRDALDKGMSQTLLAIQYDVNCSTISRIKNEKCHQNIRYVCKPMNGLVRLTIEEAKEFEAMIYDFLETFESHFDVPEWNHYVKLHQLLEKRIKQAKIKNLEHEIAQLKKEQARENLNIKRLEENYKNSKYSVLEIGTEKNDE